MRYNAARFPHSAVTRVVALLIVGALAARGAQPGVVRTFEQDVVDRPPSGFLFGAARDAAVDRWAVREVDDRRALTHLGDGGGADGLAIAVLEAPAFRDVELTVRLKTPGGLGSGGLVWRYRDAENCYLVELDLGRQDIGLYRLVRGNRIRIEREDDLELDPNAWHAIRLVHKDDTIRVYLGGVRVFRTRDRTFSGAGRVGVWSAGASTLHFDGIRAARED